MFTYCVLSQGAIKTLPVRSDRSVARDRVDVLSTRIILRPSMLKNIGIDGREQDLPASTIERVIDECCRPRGVVGWKIDWHAIYHVIAYRDHRRVEILQ